MIILTQENLFLIALGLVWIIGAIIQDLRKREVDNIWNFSLIAIALAYRLNVIIFSGNYRFFLNGIYGFLIFLALGNLFYYARLFAGGDAKLLIALGSVLPLSYSLLINLQIIGAFILLFLIGGSVYALFYSVFLIVMNWRSFIKELKNRFLDYKRLFLIALLFFIIWICLMFFLDSVRFIWVALVVPLFPILLVFSKAIEESCMIRLVNANIVTEGDWLAENVQIGEKVIKADWQGVSKSDLKLIQKSKKKVLIKYGIPFTPSFLIGFLGMILVMEKYIGLF